MLTVINRDNLRSIGEVEGKIRQLRYEVEKTQQLFNAITAELDNLKILAEQAEEYFSLSDKAERTPAEELLIIDMTGEFLKLGSTIVNGQAPAA